MSVHWDQIGSTPPYPGTALLGVKDRTQFAKGKDVVPPRLT